MGSEGGGLVKCGRSGNNLTGFKPLCLEYLGERSQGNQPGNYCY